MLHCSPYRFHTNILYTSNNNIRVNNRKMTRQRSPGATKIIFLFIHLYSFIYNDYVQLNVLPLPSVNAMEQQQQQQQPADFIVAGYLPEYRFYININNTALHLTDLILFSVEPFGTSVIPHLNEHHYQQAREAKAYKEQQVLHPNKERPLKLWLSVGGAGRSDAFSSICASSSKQQQFIQKLIQVCQKEQLDGVDFDWESPRTHHEFSSYMTFLEEASISFHRQNLLVSVATRYLQLLPSSVLQVIDRIHFMAYDLLEQPQQGVSQHHADFSKIRRTILQQSPQQQQGGFPTWTHEQQQKLILGIPMYARHGMNPQNVLTFAELIDKSQGNIKSVTQLNDWNGYRYDSPQLIQDKVSWASANNLGGIFFWELGQDKQMEDTAPGGVLLETAAKQATHKRTSQQTYPKDEL